MAVDAKRIEAIFKAAINAADPVEHAAILDRECGSDMEMRQCIEALLGVQREPSTVVDQPTVSPLEFAPPSLEITLAVDPSADPKKPGAPTPKQDQVTHDEELDECEGAPPGHSRNLPQSRRSVRTDRPTKPAHSLHPSR